MRKLPRKLTAEEIAEIRRMHKKDEMSPEKIALAKGLPYSIVYFHLVLEPRGFKSQFEYCDWLAKQQGYESRADKKQKIARQRGDKSYQGYQNRLLEKSGTTYTEQRKGWFEQRKAREAYQKFSKLVSDALDSQDKSQAELAREAGVSREIVSKYCKGEALLKDKEIRRNIAMALRIESAVLENMLEGVA